MDNLTWQTTNDLDDSSDLEVIRSSGSLEIDEYEEVIFSPDIVSKEGVFWESPYSNDFYMMLHVTINPLNEGTINSTIEITAYHIDALGMIFEENST